MGWTAAQWWGKRRGWRGAVVYLSCREAPPPNTPPPCHLLPLVLGVNFEPMPLVPLWLEAHQWSDCRESHANCVPASVSSLQRTWPLVRRTLSQHRQIHPGVKIPSLGSMNAPLLTSIITRYQYRYWGWALVTLVPIARHRYQLLTEHKKIYAVILSCVMPY